MSVRLIIVLLVGCGFIAPTIAQDANTFDRFFTTRLMRKQLDQARDQYTIIGSSRDLENEAAQEMMFPEIQVKGMMVRSDGSSEMWLNNISTIGNDAQSQDLQKNTQRVGDQSVRVTLPDGQQVTLKPGQIYLPQNQGIHELYQAYMPDESKEAKEIDQQATEEMELEASDEPTEFDESTLAETDSRIKLLEERIQDLEGQR